MLRYYFGVICKIASEHTGYTVPEIHKIHKEMFLVYPHRKQLIHNGQTIIMATTKNMTKKEFMDWCEFTLIPHWIHEGCGNIPMPNEEELWKSLLETEVV